MPICEKSADFPLICIEQYKEQWREWSQSYIFNYVIDKKKKKSWDKEDVQFHSFYSILNRKLENQWELIATCFLHKTGWKITLFNYYIWWQPHWQHCQHQILEKTSKTKSFFSTSPNQKANQNPDSCYFREYFVLCTHLFKYMCKIPLFICITWT